MHAFNLALLTMSSMQNYEEQNSKAGERVPQLPSPGLLPASLP